MFAIRWWIPENVCIKSFDRSAGIKVRTSGVKKRYIWSKRINSVENLFDDNELETEQWDRTYLQIKVNSLPVIRFIDGYEHNNDTLGYD